MWFPGDIGRKDKDGLVYKDATWTTPTENLFVYNGKASEIPDQSKFIALADTEKLVFNLNIRGV